MIPIKNLYYMLSYAFRILTENGYKNLEVEEFDNAAELCAAILSKSVYLQVKRGLAKEYVIQTDELSGIKGKIDITDSIKRQTLINKKMVCNYDEFLINSELNKIIKVTLKILINSDISKIRKIELKKILVFFEEVDDIDWHLINWKQKYSKNNQTYRLLISICYLVIKGLIQTNSKGSIKMMDFFDEQRMCRLYEKFIYEYCSKEFPNLKVKASQIPWILDDEVGDMLPIMQSDITVSKGNDILIIDAKYYNSITQTKFDKQTFHSNNLYQIFTYVKNKEAELINVEHNVSGLLLYAKTEHSDVINRKYKMSGNEISIKTLDLNCDFSEIKNQINSIIGEKF